MQRSEFTVENGEVYILQSRYNDRSALRSVTIAVNKEKSFNIIEKMKL
jgi:hypothetical protein